VETQNFNCNIVSWDWYQDTYFSFHSNIFDAMKVKWNIFFPEHKKDTKRQIITTTTVKYAFNYMFVTWTTFFFVKNNFKFLQYHNFLKDPFGFSQNGTFLMVKLNSMWIYHTEGFQDLMEMLINIKYTEDVLCTVKLLDKTKRNSNGCD